MFMQGVREYTMLMELNEKKLFIYNYLYDNIITLICTNKDV